MAPIPTYATDVAVAGILFARLEPGLATARLSRSLLRLGAQVFQAGGFDIGILLDQAQLRIEQLTEDGEIITLSTPD